jgi:hypothetical protein
MKPNDLEEGLRMSLSNPSPPAPDHQKCLEERLVARFEARHPKKEVPMFRALIKPAAFAVVAIAGLGFASQTPTTLPVEVGKSVDVTFADKAPPGFDPSTVAERLRSLASEGSTPRELEIQVAVRATPEGVQSIHVELWGDTLPLTTIEKTLRESIPGLAKATIVVTPLEGRVHTTFAHRVALKLSLDKAATPEQIEQARKDLVAQIRASGERGNVEVQIEGNGAERRVKVKVERKESDEKQSPAK